MSAPFIVVEGIDGSGKSTLAHNLVKRLRADSRSVTLTREPYDPVPLGKERGRIREALMAPADSKADPAQLAIMFAADRFAHIDDVIRPARAAGNIVVCDRYILSTLVYQSLKLSEDFVFQLVRPAPRPDLTILLDMDPEAARERLLARGLPLESYERNLETQVALRERYLDFVSRPQYYGNGAVIIVPAAVTASEPPDTLADHVRGLVAQWEQHPEAQPKPPEYQHPIGAAYRAIAERIGVAAETRKLAADVGRAAADVESARRRTHAAAVAAWATRQPEQRVLRAGDSSYVTELRGTIAQIVAAQRENERVEFMANMSGQVSQPRAG